MTWEYQAETWMYYGLSDLYYSFHTSEEWVFDYHCSFFAVTALEKYLKSRLIYSKKDLDPDATETEVESKFMSIAKKYSHKFEEMMCEAESLAGGDRLSSVLDRSHDGYIGRELVLVLKDAYMETRYPTSQYVSHAFPVGDNMYHNPLSSSGLLHFVQAACRELTYVLAASINVPKVYENVEKTYSHLEPFSRFKNIYTPELWAKST